MRGLFVLPAIATMLGACSGQGANGSGGGGSGGAAETTVDKLKAMGGTPCAHDDAYLCVALPVPLDHFSASGGKTIDVTFAVLPAPADKRRGMLVTAEGGPGYAGTDDLYPWKLIDPRFAEEFDTVYFDLRGVKTSGDLACPKAAAAFYLGGLRVADGSDEQTLTAKSKTFATDCTTEMGIPEGEMPFYDTAQAVEDLEAFRVAMGVDQLSLYGLSYGTQFMQTYAVKHGSNVRVLVLDGTIDLTRAHLDYMTDLNDAIDELLDRTLADCAGRSDCAADYDAAPGATALDRVRAAYDAVAAALEASPMTVEFPLKASGTSKRIFSRADLDTTTFDALGDPSSRRDFLTALALAFQQQDFLPLLKLSYSSAGIDGQTAGPIGTAGADPGMSDAIYYTFTCNDYGNDASTAAARQTNYLASGRKLWIDPRVLSPYYGDDPCPYWPVTKSAVTVPPAALDGIPTIVVNATGDGSVPHDQGEAVASRLADGYLVEIDGGHHVMYGTGVPCIDDLVTPFLLDLKPPAKRSTMCSGHFVAP